MSLIPSGFAKSAAGGFYDHPIEQSLRFNDADNSGLLRTTTSASTGTTATFSTWVKRAKLGEEQFICISSNTSGSDVTSFAVVFDSDDTIKIVNQGTYLYTNAVYRDTSAWYHIVLVSDTNNSTSSDRTRLYVNGERVTSFSSATYPSQGASALLQSGYYVQVGYDYWSTRDLSGYLAETHFIDGTALDASSFGETKSGVWIPKAYSGSYGTNGFYLDFGNSGSIGADVSGNGNNFTANNLAATDVVLDSPTNNFATLNAVVASSNGLSEGNLKQTGIGLSNIDQPKLGSIGMSSGKYYWEYAVTTASGAPANLSFAVGVATSNETNTNPNNTATSDRWAYRANFASGDIVSVAYDADAKKLWVALNNTWISSGDPSAGTNQYHDITVDTVLPYSWLRDNPVWVLNFGQDSSFAGNKTAQGNTDANGYGDFYYAPPSGYLALCTANLPDPVASIDPAQDGSPQDHFNTVLYTGNGSNDHAITGVGFQPDLLWVKARNAAYNNCLTDSVRGFPNVLYSDSTAVENATGAYSNVQSFDADGFTLDAATTTDLVNGSGVTHVGWNWKANGSGVSNTDGSITSTVSANIDAGFSIVSYTGTGANATVGHGLDSAPEMIIAKNRDTSDSYSNWAVYHVGLSSSSQYLNLNTTSAATTNSIVWTTTPPSSTVFNVGSAYASNRSGESIIAYCFHSVDGFSKFGSYTGNGSADGPFVYTGFRPAFVMIKNTQNGTNSWVIADSKRNTFNEVDLWLQPNGNYAESNLGTTYDIDFLSSGFKIRDATNFLNQSTYKLIYMAFAENPFKYSTAR